MKYIYAILIFIGLSASAFADVFQGQWICTITNAEDNSSSDMVYEISGKTLKSKYRGSSIHSDYSLALRGKTNPFIVFVEEGNSITETIIVLQTTGSKNQLHVNTTRTSDNVRVKARSSYGICDRV